MLKKKYNVSAKRKELYKLTYTIYDFYANFENSYKITKEQYINILKDFYNLLVENVITGRKRIVLPYNLGVHRIQKHKQSLISRPKIDYNKSKKYDKIIYHLNMHSGGYYFKWKWEKAPFFIKNKQFYKFELHKSNKGYLSKEIFKCNTDPYKKDYNALS